jgi:hypothetical protein
VHALRTVVRVLPAAIVLVAGLTAASAQSAAPAATDTKQMSAQPAQPAPKKWYDTITFKGYMQLDAIFPEGQAQASAGNVSNIRVRRGRPTFVAQLDPQNSIQVQFDVSTGAGNSKGTSRQNATVIATFADHVFSKYCYARFGQMLLPFGHEVHEDNAGVRSPLELSYAASSIALGEFDAGIMLGSQIPEDQPIHWEFGFFDGQGMSTADANPNKVFIGRLALRPNPIVRFGVNAMVGKYTDTSKTGGLTYNRDVLAGEVAVHPSKALQLSSEVYNVLFVDSPTAPTKTSRFTGGYLMLESWIGPLKSIPFLRYQRTYGDLDYRSIDLGWRYQYASNQRLTLEYDIVRAADHDMAGVRWQLNF